jgi:hypothetical protein
MALCPLNTVGRVVDYRPDARFLGPDRELLCPCGSRRRARGCHSDASGYWVASDPAALMTGERTGFSHDLCYANSSGDCSTTISREHWMSKGILLALSTNGRGVMVSGASWLNGNSRELRASDLAANILCTRHNSALSPLDTAAAEMVSYIRADQEDLERLDATSALTLISGPTWERWMLKLLLGGMASGTLAHDGKRIEEWAADVDVPGLTEVLFYGRPFRQDTGMAIRAEQPPPNSTPTEVGVTGLSSTRQGGLIGVALAIGAVELDLGVVPLGDILRRRVGLLRVRRTEPEVDKFLAFAWDAPNPEVVDLTRHEGQPS